MVKIVNLLGNRASKEKHKDRDNKKYTHGLYNGFYLLNFAPEMKTM